MKIVVNTKSFKKIIELVDNANYKVSGGENESINIPSIMINVCEGKVFLVALNREFFIKVPFEAEIVDKGFVAVDSATIKKTIKTISAESFTIILDETKNKVRLEVGEDSIEMENLDLNKFKKLPSFTNKEKLCDVIAGVLSNSIKAVSSAIPTKAPQDALNSCCLEFSIEGISFVGFDGYKLIKYNLELEDMDNLNFPESILIPAEASFAISKSLAKGKAPVSLSFCKMNDKKYLIIEKDEIIIATRLRDNNYPNYEKLIHTELKYDFCFSFDKSSLKETITSVSGSSKEVLPVHFVFNDSTKVTLRFVTPDSTIVKTLPIESSEGNLQKIKLLAKSFKEVFPYLKDKINIKVFKNGLVIITPKDEESYIFVTRTME